MPRPLKIAVDVRDLRSAKTGTRTYLTELCNEFKKMEAEDLRFYFLDTRFPVYSGKNKLLKLAEHGRYQLWKQLILPLKAFFKGCNIVFCTDNFVPIIHLGYKTIPVFHDAFFFETPQNYGKLWLWLYKKTALPAAKRSPFIITPSAWAKKQISHYTKIDTDKLIVIPEGAKTLAGNNTGDNAAELLSRFSLNPKSYLLHVGSMFKRKNIPALLHAFSEVKASGYPQLKLVLAGPAPSMLIDSDYLLIIDTISQLNLQNEVILTGYLPDTTLGQLYQNALLYIFPSINEGFGIPVLEAFSYNLPVLVSDNTCLPEVGGDAVLSFNPFDTGDISKKIKMALDNPDLRSSLAHKGTTRLKLFSWRNTALQLVNVFKAAV
ncbi:glycosyltransferase family 1 protein [Mucilaginibacter sp. UR6-11]|uniref:glycosyltransferase family 4 protein n=1 Tax=Mucilaginibacter sp. UR6-11 TaxID=1435644 RepID=UPI001E2F0833|nr:glycosyltransferase family 1 protein [Mucilaginibacter sp. UR6-11]MCC8423959.1 glycosyltransferase family 4 protein [Mucilaginibacter sp. UR6-11]